MGRKTLQIEFPAAGVVRRFGYRSTANAKAPFPSPWSVNVRLEDELTNRLRGGSFTGLSVSTTPSTEYVFLTTENGDNIVTENGAYIVLGPQY